MLRLEDAEGIAAVPVATPGHVTQVLAAVGANETQTFGVIEQRLTDAVTTILHRRDEGWQSHGVGDSVNASNLSRRKIGDCEFQTSEPRPTVVAYEAHAGRLSGVYVDRHLQSLRRIIPLRAEGWERSAPREEWTLKIVFLAHNIEGAEARVAEISGYRVEVVVETYSKFCQDAPPSHVLLPAYEEHVVTRLNQIGTPQSVRNRYIGIVAEGH
jgi:hypothetical protein